MNIIKNSAVKTIYLNLDYLLKNYIISKTESQVLFNLVIWYNNRNGKRN